MNHNGKWHLKYEPTTIDDMVLNVETRKRLNYVMNKKQDAILYGPPGCGKGTFANILKDNPNYAPMWINAAKEGGIDKMRDKVKVFCNAASTYELKQLFFNEAEKLSKNAQQYLRETMETAVITQFIFMTNDIEKIEAPIKSRCVDVEYRNPAQGDVLNFMKGILEAEGIDYNNRSLTTLVGRHYPDIRKTINEMQAAFSL